MAVNLQRRRRSRQRKQSGTQACSPRASAGAAGFLTRFACRSMCWLVCSFCVEYSSTTLGEERSRLRKGTDGGGFCGWAVGAVGAGGRHCVCVRVVRDEWRLARGGCCGHIHGAGHRVVCRVCGLDASTGRRRNAGAGIASTGGGVAPALVTAVARPPTLLGPLSVQCMWLI